VSRNVIDQVKLWITPGIIGIIGMFIWRDLTELRSDVKQLLLQNAEDHTKLIRLDNDVNMLKQKVFFQPADKPVAIKEEEYQIKPQKKRG
jgi:hypothetical protein